MGKKKSNGEGSIVKRKDGRYMARLAVPAVENGLCVYTEQITSNTFSHESILKVGNLSVNFQRAELWGENGRCILVTNPIYLIQTELFAGDIPYDRIPDVE